MRVAKHVAVLLLLAGGLWAISGTHNMHDPVADWLVWRYLVICLLIGFWALSCLSLGFALGRPLGLTRLPARECLMQSFALGVFGFAFVTVLLGFVHGLGWLAAILMPLAALASGARWLWKYGRRFVRRLRRIGKPLGLLGKVAVLYAALCLVALYLDILTPGNVHYDSRWYHLPLAEHYAALGAVTRFNEGWYAAALPHLASLLYTWAFSLPFAGLVHRIELAAHLEYLLLLATLLSLPVGIDLFLKRPRVQAGWAAFFLFPGILLYDSNLGGAADHVLAFWTIPLLVALRRYWRRPDVRGAVLLALMAAAAAMTKYQAIYLLILPAVAVLITLRRSPRAALAVAGTVLVVTAPHWLKNLIWYGDPLYPMLGSGHPNVPGTTSIMQSASFSPQGTLTEKLWQTVKGVATFGFVAHDWTTFHGARPVYGSLFLPAVVLLPFAKARAWIFAMAAGLLAGIATWFFTHHQDRYLQALTPWLVVVILAAFVGIWRHVLLARPLVLLLVAFQVLACADIYFLPNHAMINTSPLLKAIELITSGHRKALSERENTGSHLVDVPAHMPRDGKLLVHESHLCLGSSRAVVHDPRGIQGGISYAHWGDTGTVLKNLRAIGVTHATWAPSPANLELSGDEMVWFRFAQQLPGAKTLQSGWRFAALPPGELTSNPSYAFLTCTIERLTAEQIQDQWQRLYYLACDAPSGDVQAALDTSDVVVVDLHRYLNGQPPTGMPGFTHLFDRNHFRIYGRNPP